MAENKDIGELLAVIVQKYGPFEITEKDASECLAGVQVWVDYNQTIHVESFTEEDNEVTDQAAE